MATITTKYSIGDKVYHATTTTEKKRHPCPDCLGERKWSVKSPGGIDYTIDCPRCSASYNSDRDLTLDYSVLVPRAGALTIGSIQYNSVPSSYDHGARYMCRETGVGSGSVYNEADLFLTEEEALAAAKIKADLANEKTEWVVKQYNKTLKVSDYQLDSATLKLAKEAESRARSMLWNLGDLFGRIDESESLSDIKEAVEEYRQYDWERDNYEDEPWLDVVVEDARSA